METLRQPDPRIMARAISLAERGRGFVHPNPLVGAVLVRDDGRILGEGHHARFGGAHAEVAAIEDARRLGATEADFARSALYVTLEPCAHTGKTPPCTEAILAAGVPVVHIAATDPDHHGTEGGVAALRRAGVFVTEGCLAEEARQQNAAYFHYLATGLPRVTVKLAASLDGKIADAAGASRWITGEEARAAVDGMRAAADAVVVGVGTVLADDPGLRVRTALRPEAPRRDPVRIVLDPSARTPLGARLVAENDDGRTVLVLGENLPPEAERRAVALADRVRILRAPAAAGGLDLGEALRTIARQGWLDLLVEAGPRLFAALVGAGLADRIAVFFAPILLGGKASGFSDLLEVAGLGAAPRFRRRSFRAVGEDLLAVFERCSPESSAA